MVSNLFREHLKQIVPYSTARDEFPGAARVYLDANENPFEADLNRYPDPHARQLTEALASIKGVSPEQLFVGNGSDEAIDLLIRTVVNPGDGVVITPPTYGMYAVAARNHGAVVLSAPLSKDFSLDLEAIRLASHQGGKLLFLCSPNNPTGNQFSLAEIARVLDCFPGLVVVDEAYIDFASGPSAVSLLDGRERLVVLQTLSKAWGLAGARVGIALGAPALITLLRAIKLPYNVNTLSQRAALVRLQEVERFKEEVAVLVQQREWLTKTLSTLSGVLQVYPSQGNFLLVQIRGSSQVFEALRAEGVIVRDRSRELHCEECLRISIGTPEENELLVEAIRRCI